MSHSNQKTTLPESLRPLAKNVPSEVLKKLEKRAEDNGWGISRWEYHLGKHQPNPSEK